MLEEKKEGNKRRINDERADDQHMGQEAASSSGSTKRAVEEPAGLRVGRSREDVEGGRGVKRRMEDDQGGRERLAKVSVNELGVTQKLDVESDTFVDEGTCETLDPFEVREARSEDIELMKKIFLYVEASTTECWETTGKNPISTKTWVDASKGTSAEGEGTGGSLPPPCSSRPRSCCSTWRLCNMVDVHQRQKKAHLKRRGAERSLPLRRVGRRGGCRREMRSSVEVAVRDAASGVSAGEGLRRQVDARKISSRAPKAFFGVGLASERLCAGMTLLSWVVQRAKNGESKLKEW